MRLNLSSLDPERPGDALVLHVPCRRKSCHPCWLDYRERVAERVVRSFTAMAPRPRCPSFAGIFLTNKQNWDIAWAARRKLLWRSGSEWVVVPLEAGQIALLAWPGLPGFTIPVLDFGAAVEQLLDRHDRSKRINSSQGLRAAARPLPTWRLLGVTALTLERVCDILEQMGLTYRWNGVDCIYIFNATPQQLTDLQMRLSA